ncbi:TetR/AcrR family transcriptional regulator C-terminal domain-containing protein [Kitasatospora sp. NPDC048540]|uniref:TetR/AcrR family transcriptional regulator C-terminal domain-containing protein n=1 Tax=Kitasatospora sp. NPDC048540 TaxID=3155634 RepID=UPI0033C41DA8
MAATARRAGLNRTKVLRAALELADREGVERLSMRRLGTELGVEAMTLYHYVPNKGALLDGLVELVVAAVRPGPPAGADDPVDDPTADDPAHWPARLRAFAVAFRTQLLRHPGVIPLVATRPVGSPDALRAVEETAAALGRAGLPPLLALRIVNAVATFVIGHCLAEAATTPGHPEEPAPAPDLTGFPTLAAAVADGLGTPADHQARFDLALDALITGLAATPR